MISSQIIPWFTRLRANYDSEKFFLASEAGARILKAGVPRHSRLDAPTTITMHSNFRPILSRAYSRFFIQGKLNIMNQGHYSLKAVSLATGYGYLIRVGLPGRWRSKAPCCPNRTYHCSLRDGLQSIPSMEIIFRP